MHIFKSFLLVASLFASFIEPLYAATLSLTTNQVIFNPGNTLSLSGNIIPTDDANIWSDIYVAVVLPNNTVLTLDGNLDWKPTLEPILTAFPLAKIQAPNFYSLPLPSNLPTGVYNFYLVTVPTGADPLNSSTWLGYAIAPITFQQEPSYQSCSPPQKLSAAKFTPRAVYQTPKQMWDNLSGTWSGCDIYGNTVKINFSGNTAEGTISRHTNYYGTYSNCIYKLQSWYAFTDIGEWSFNVTSLNCAEGDGLDHTHGDIINVYAKGTPGSATELMLEFGFLPFVTMLKQ